MTNLRESAEQKVLEAIQEFEGKPYGPSRRDLHKITGIGLGTVQGIVKALAAAGKIEYSPFVARSIRIRIQ